MAKESFKGKGREDLIERIRQLKEQRNYAIMWVVLLALLSGGCI